MTPMVTVYAGTCDVDGLSDLTTAAEVADAIDRSDGLLIRDPLAFPWDALGRYPTTPLIVDVSDLPDPDLRALVPVLGVLTQSDVLWGDRKAVDSIGDQLGLPGLWASSDISVAEHVRTTLDRKRCEVEERIIVERLADDDGLTVLLMEGDEIRAPGGFAEVLRKRLEAEGLGRAVVDTIWGVRAGPGVPVERAVIALRSTGGSVDLP